MRDAQVRQTMVRAPLRLRASGDDRVANTRQVIKMVNSCGHGRDFVAWPEADGYRRLAPVSGTAN